MTCAQLLSHVGLLAAPWTIACQAPLPMEFSRQEYRSGVPFPTLGDLPDLGIKPGSLESPASADVFFTMSAMVKVAINQDEKCSDGTDLGEKTRNSPPVM